MASIQGLLQNQVQTLSNVFQNCYEMGEVVELRTKFIAFATDTVTRYALGESMGLQNDQRSAEEWQQTIRAVAGLTPIVKQFPWTISLSKNLPVDAVRLVHPELARVAQLHHVSGF